MPLRIALNLVYLVPGEVGGMETYARELIPRLAATDGVQVTCLVNREAAGDSAGPWGSVAPMEVVPVHARSRIHWVRGEQQYVPRIAARLGADVIHSLASTAPLWGAVPRVTTIHDLSYALVPEAHFGLRALGMRLLVPASARRSRRVIVDASSTRDDLSRLLHIDPSKVDVVPLAASPPDDAIATDVAILRDRLGLGARTVVLSPGAKRPHKNLATAIDALALLPERQRPVLVATGYRTPYEAELRARAESLGVADDLVMPEWLTAADLEALYAVSSLVVFISRSEGFGLPVLEAMGRGVPVITSDCSSMPEVAGGAARLVSPDDPRAVADAMAALLNKPGERAALSSAGRARAEQFSWERTAALTVASYRRALGR